MDKKERVERALAFDSPDRPPLCDSFQHTGIIHHYAEVPDRPDWTREEVCAAAGNAVDMVQGWGLGPSLKKGEYMSTGTAAHGVQIPGFPRS